MPSGLGDHQQPARCAQHLCVQGRELLRVGREGRIRFVVICGQRIVELAAAVRSPSGRPTARSAHRPATAPAGRAHRQRAWPWSTTSSSRWRGYCATSSARRSSSSKRGSSSVSRSSCVSAPALRASALPASTSTAQLLRVIDRGAHQAAGAEAAGHRHPAGPGFPDSRDRRCRPRWSVSAYSGTRPASPGRAPVGR